MCLQTEDNEQRRILIAAPHPDDETFGCGGSILRWIAEGSAVHWMIITTMEGAPEFSLDAVKKRDRLIRAVSDAYGFAGVHQLMYPAGHLDSMARKTIIQSVKEVFAKVEPTEVLCPYRYDAHSDHGVAYEVVAACSKSFRTKCLRRLMMYETLSETNFSSEPGTAYIPNFFVDISEFLARKLEIVAMYSTEIGQHPFPRSIRACEALAVLRGSQAGCEAAEGFQLVRHVE